MHLRLQCFFTFGPEVYDFDGGFADVPFFKGRDMVYLRISTGVLLHYGAQSVFFPHSAKFRTVFFDASKVHALGLKVWPRHRVLDNEFAFAMLFYIWA